MDDAHASGAAVVVSFGDPQILLANPLLARDSGWPVIVVDNFSTAENRASARRLAGERGWDLVEPDRNLGFGAGVNLGVERAASTGFDAFVVVNPDAELAPDAAAQLLAHVREHPGTLAGPRIVRPDGTLWFAGGWLDVRTGRTTTNPGGRGAVGEPTWLSGACIATTIAAWRQYGGFDDEFFLYWEDVDLSVRWARNGGRLDVLQDVLCTHSVGGTQQAVSQRAKSRAYYYYNCRNRLLFASRHLGRRDRWRWAANALPYARAVVLRGGRRQLRHPGPTIGAALRGTVAGLGNLVRPGPAAGDG